MPPDSAPFAVAIKSRKFIYLFVTLIAIAFIGYIYNRTIKSGSAGLYQELSIPQLAPTEEIGFLPGTFTVSSSGSAIYTIPLVAPVGTNHTQPDLSLIYSNDNGNGIFGVGWQLNGLSSITRTGKIWGADSIKSGIGFNSSDRFLINGQRLIAYRDKSGKILNTLSERDTAYGLDGTGYRTEIESWIRLTSYGSCGAGPCYFIMESRNGSRTEYGNSPDSGISSFEDSTIISWNVNKITDKNGNYVLVNYDNSKGKGIILPKEILYTGNEKGNLVPQRKIEFVSEPRNDSISKNLAGKILTCHARISAIRSYVDLDGDGQNIENNSNLVSAYSIKYNYSSLTGRSLVNSITLCDSKGKCLPATQFTLTSPRQTDYFKSAKASPPDFYTKLLDNSTKKIRADFDGDGLIDIALLNNNAQTIPVIFSKQNISFYSTNKSIPPAYGRLLNSKNVQLFVGDFDGDGKTDLSFIESNNPIIYLLISKGDGNFQGQSLVVPKEFWYMFNSANVEIIAGDYNGDGLTDFAGFGPGFKNIPLLLKQYQDTVTGMQIPVPEQLLEVFRDNTEKIPGDFNGDGLLDIAFFGKGYKTLPILFSKPGNGFYATVFPYPVKFDQYFGSAGSEKIAGDFNGDGLLDFAVFNKGYAHLPVIYSKGDGNFIGNQIPFPENSSALFNANGVQKITGDFNGDGITDISAFATGYKTIPSLFSFEEGNYQLIRNTLDPVNQLINTNGIERLIGDFNGDGLLDIAGIKTGLGNIPIILSNKATVINNQPDKVIQITNGIGQIISISYRPMTDSSVYSSNSERLNYPYLSIIHPKELVSSYQIETSDSTTSISAKYSYANSIISHYRGWLGFRQTSVSSNQDSIVTTYNRIIDFPLSGLIWKTELNDKAEPAKCLGKTTHEYGFRQDSTTGVFRVGIQLERIQHYTEGHFNYTLLKRYHYEQSNKNLIRIDNYGDTGTANDDSYIYFRYGQSGLQKETWWSALYPVSEKITKDTNTGVDWTKWTPKDYTWKQYRYDDRMNIIAGLSFRDKIGTNVVNDWTGDTYKFDIYGNPVLTISPPNYSSDSIVQAIEYDSIYHTFPVKHLSPIPNPGKSNRRQLISKYSFDPRFGVKILEVDPNSRVVSYIPPEGIDGLGRIIKIQRTMPNSDSLATITSTKFSSNKSGGYFSAVYSPTSWEDVTEINKTWTWTENYYDALNRKTKSTSSGYFPATTLITQVQFNPIGKQEKQFLPYFNDTATGSGQSRNEDESRSCYKTTYDKYGRILQVWSPALGPEQGDFLLKYYDYSKTDSRIIFERNRSSANDLEFAGWKTQYNSYGKIIEKSGPYDNKNNPLAGFSISRYNYDALGRLISKVDPMKEITTQTFNSIGELIKTFNPETGEELFNYNKNNWITERIDAKGQRISWRYDDLGRVLLEQSITRLEKIESETKYIYDNDSISANGKGRLSRIVSGLRESTFNYDNTGAISREIIFSKTLGQIFIQRYSYNAAGRLQKVEFPDSTLVEYVYRGAYLDHILLNNRDTIVHFENYNSFGEAEHVRYQNNVTAEYGFDRIGRPQNAITQKGSYTHQNLRYYWTKANKLDSIADQRINPEINISQSYSYSVPGRMIEAKGRYGIEEYAYDASGNQLSKNETVYSYDPEKKHQLVKITDKNKTLATLQYDETGYLTKKSISTSTSSNINDIFYSYDAKGHLTEAISQSVNSADTLNRSFYEINGNRTIKIDPGRATTHYIFPNYEVVQLPSGEQIHTSYISAAKGIIFSQSHDSRNIRLNTHGTTTFDQKSNNHPLLPGKNGKGVPEAGEIRFFHRNHIGSSVLLTDETGALANSLNYKPYGELDEQNSTGTDNFRSKFTGKEYDDLTGLYYFGSRYYDGQLGRFISPDPAKQYSSPYIYGAGNPTAGSDPNGQFFGEIAAAAAILEVGYVGGAIANHSLNPAAWNWNSAKTWIGIVNAEVTAAAVLATIVTLGADTPVLGAVLSEDAIGMISASSEILNATANAINLGSDAYSFSKNPSFSNGIFISLDLVPYAGQLLGKSRSVLNDVKSDLEDAGIEMSDMSRQDHVVEPFSCPLNQSFPEGTKILTEQGVKAIEELQVGDLVWSYDEATGSKLLSPVSKLYKRSTGKLIQLILGKDTILATPEHPVFLKDKKWTELSRVTVKDTVVTFGSGSGGSSGYALVTEIITKSGVPYFVYNVEVENTHNYFVSSAGFLFHNPPCAFSRRQHYGPNGNLVREDIEFSITKNDLGTGSPTNQAMRDYVNHPNTPAPSEITIRYEVYDRQDFMTTSRTRNNIANPAIPGVPWDAGHLQSRANGGIGIVIDNIFPQNKYLNRGWNGMFKSWRKIEDLITHYVQEQRTDYVTQYITLHY